MQLAQLNIADAKHEMEAPELHGFVSRIAAINALADRAEGFIWRLEDDGPEPGALSLRMEGLGPDTLVNMSVWQDLNALYQFVYKTAHAKVMQEERPQFHRIPTEHMVLWWIEDGHIPNLDEARLKLDLIRENGPEPDAFSFAHPFDEKGRTMRSLFTQKDHA